MTLGLFWLKHLSHPVFLLHSFYIKERLIFGLKLDVLNYFEVSTSSVLKMFLNMIVSIRCAVVIFRTLRTNQPETRMRFIEIATILAGKKEI